MLDRSRLVREMADLDDPGLRHDLRVPRPGYSGVLRRHCHDYLDEEQSGGHESPRQLEKDENYE